MHVKRKWKVWMSIFLSLYLVVPSLGAARRNGGAPVEVERTTPYTTRVVDSPSALMGPQLQKQINKTIRYVIAVEKSKQEQAFYIAIRKREKKQEAAQRSVAAASISQPSYPASTPTPRGDVWWELAGCETGYKYDNPNTGNGYYGFFQFSLNTWRRVGGTGYPHQHSYGVQLQFAQKLAETANPYAQWPICWSKAVS